MHEAIKNYRTITKATLIYTLCGDDCGGLVLLSHDHVEGHQVVTCSKPITIGSSTCHCGTRALDHVIEIFINFNENRRR